MLETLAKYSAVAVFLIVFSFVGFVLWSSLFPTKEIITNANSTQEQQAENKSAAEISPVDKAKITSDERLANYTAALAVFTALLVMVSAFQIAYLASADKTATRAANAAKDSADISAKALIAANRPWIKVDIQVGGPIFYNVNGANFTLRYILTNVGHAPATNVWISPRVTFPVLREDRPGVYSARTEMLKEIAALKSRPPSPFGYSMFPGETITQDILVTMSNADIELATKLIKAIYPDVVGAVDYRMGFDDKPHQTGFIVQIRRSDTPRPTAKDRSPSAIWIDEGDVPASEVRLSRSIIEGGYAD
jgi:hypothetical protein